MEQTMEQTMEQAVERTFIAVKPDGVQRGLCGEIIKRFEQKGFKLIAAKVVKASKERIERQYPDLTRRSFYSRFVKYMTSGPMLAMVWEGLNIVKMAKTMIGETEPADSKPGSIRGDLCIDIDRNIIHGSDTAEIAEKEMALWFEPGDLVSYKLCTEIWLYQ